MIKLHPIFEQALAPFLKPVATRNGPVDHDPNARSCPCADCVDFRALLFNARQFPPHGIATYPYPNCRQKDKCRGKGSCPLDPTCGD